MNTHCFFALALAVLLISCKGNGDKSDAYGNFETDETIVSSEVNGQLVTLSADLGDRVKKGELLAMVDTTRLSLQIEQLEAQRKSVNTKKVNVRAQVNVLKQQMRNRKIKQDRIHHLFADKAATRQQVDDVDGQMLVMEKQLLELNTQYISINSDRNVLDAQLAVMKNKWQKCFVESPMSGVVLEKYAEPGEIVSSARAIVKLGDLSELNLRVYVSGAQLPSVKLGQRVQVLIDKDKKRNQSLTGVISWISSEAEFTPKIIQTKEERVKLVYAVKVRVKNDGRLKIGMPGEVRFLR